jgi:outer membrane protein assembly factor BamB
MTRRHAALLLLLAAAATADAQDWPQFRGPTGQGHSPEHGIPLEWSEASHVSWKTRVPGIGWSSPVVSGGRIWMTTAVGSSLRVLAYAVDSGREVVNVELFRRRGTETHFKNSPASPTPVISGDRVYVHFGADGTAALTAAGAVVWRTTLRYESQHGNGGSPVLHGDLLIVNCDGSDEAYVVALDVHTGRTRWKTPRRRPYDQAYSTPLVIRVGDRDQLVSAGAHRAAGYDPQTGKELWRVSYEGGFSNVPRPVFANGLLYIISGWTSPPYLLAVRPDGTGDVTRSHVAWTLRRAVPYIVSPIAVGGELYVLDDGGILTCLDGTTGATLWMQRVPGNYAASPVYADGRIYMQSEEGLTTVIAPGRVFKQLAVNRLDGEVLASLAVASGSIYIRTNAHLYKIQ